MSIHSLWTPEGALTQKHHICITEVTEFMTLQEIPYMDKAIAISVTE